MNQYGNIHHPSGMVRPAGQRKASRQRISRLRCLLYLLLFLLFGLHGTAQKTGKQSFSMNPGENYIYEVSFKWGLLLRAGEASFAYKPDQSVAGATSHYHMTFKSAKFFDSFFKMRDTLSTYYNDNNTLVYSIKNSDEGNYYTIDILNFKKEGDNTTVHSQRYVPPVKKIDTILTAQGDVADLLGVIFYIRGINRSLLKSGDVFPLTVAIGKDLVKIQFIYQNPTPITQGNVKYNTHYFKIDIFDDAFESTKTAAEVWVGDDDNFLPIKVRSKLKIGYVEIYYKSSSGLAHPFNSRIEKKN